VTAGRVGLFDGLSQRHVDDDVLLTSQQDGGNSSAEPSPLLIPAKHYAVISAVRSSPPPDLGLPIASDDVGAVTATDGPPDLEPVSDVSAKSRSDNVNVKVPSDADATVADHAVSLTSVAPPAITENGVIVIE